MTLTSGTRLGPYEVTALLAAGGMGEVYVARDVRLGRELALKVLPVAGSDAAAIARFLREARAASVLNHPNIVTVYDVGSDATASFIAMELVRGRALRALGPAPLDPRTVADVGRQVARALDVAHDAGIVHRDIKPDNVMVRDDGLVKVLDFGIARLLEAAPGEILDGGTLTRPGFSLGTIRYMSPEQACGDVVGTASDVFSLGTLLYEIATGVYPFAEQSERAILGAICTRQPTPPSKIVSGLPAELEGLLLAMLAKEPSARPTAARVSQALAGLVAETGAATARMTTSRPRVHVVGRERERTLIESALSAAAEGRGSIFCVAGEAGMGKTTLVESVLLDLRQADHRFLVARGHCSERLARAEAYLPWLEALEDLLRTDVTGLSARAIRAVAPNWYNQVVPSTPDVGEGSQPAPQSQERLARELAALLEDLARSQMLVLFFDDLHWADVSSIDFLAYFAPRLASLRILVVATYRESELLLGNHPFAALNRDLQSRRISRELRLDYLRPEDTAEYIRIEFPGHRLPPAFLGIIHERTGGSPLFLVDLMRYLREEGVLRRTPTGWDLARPLSEIEGELPASTRNMIQRKIDQLDDAGRRLLVAASVQGHEFDSAAVAAALDADPADVEERLARLEAVNVLVQRFEERQLPDRTISVRYRFVHVLYQNVLYASLTPSRRAALSARVARSLLGFHGDRAGEIAAELAVLFEAARDPASAAAHFAMAAQHAARVFANREAEGYARRGLALCSQLPATPERARLELGLLLQLEFVLRHQRGYADAESWQCAKRARELCEAMGDVPALAQALFGLFTHSLIVADLDAALDVAEQLMRIAEQTGDRTGLLGASLAMACTLLHLGELAPADALFDRAIASHDPRRSAESRALLGMDPGINARALSTQGLWLMGRSREAATRVQETLAIAQAANDPGGLAFALVFVAYHHQAAGDAAETLAWADSCLAHCEEHGITQEPFWVLPVRGWALAHLGRGDEGIAQLRACLDAHRAVGSQLELPYYLVLLADALLHLARPEEARDVLREALRVAEATGQRLYEAEIHRLSGLAQLALAGAEPSAADREAAAALFEKARTTAQRIGARYLVERAERSLAELHRA